MKGLAIALLLLTHETVTPYKIRLRKENFQKKKKLKSLTFHTIMITLKPLTYI